jgi:Transcriptional regulator PadR-like family
VATIIRPRTERGTVQNAILALLAERPRHGYELRDLFQAALGGHWQLNSGQIYSSLERLSRDGLVVEEGVERAANPLTAAVLKGRTDLFQGLRGALEPATVQQMLGDYEAYIVQLQQAGLIRDDLPVSVITFITSALKIGVINTPDLFGPDQTPSLEQLTEPISDLIRRWLEPNCPPNDQEAGKRFVAEWLERLLVMEQDLQQTE